MKLISLEDMVKSGAIFFLESKGCLLTLQHSSEPKVVLNVLS